MLGAVDGESQAPNDWLVGMGVLLVEYCAESGLLLASEDAMVVPTSVHILTSDSEEGSVLLLQPPLILLPLPPHSLIGETPFGAD